ncbi:hypothetical protein ACX9NE_16940 [Mycobacterium sp. ML4]
MTILRVEMDRLAGLAQALYGLADEAGGLSTAKSASNPLALAVAAQRGLTSMGKDAPTAVTEAFSIDHDLVAGQMIPAVKERLHETGRVLADTANKFRDADEVKVSVGTAMSAYINATGDWNVPA